MDTAQPIGTKLEPVRAQDPIAFSAKES